MKKLLRFYVYIKPSLFPLIVAVVCGSVFGASSGLMPAVFKYVLQGVFEKQGEFKPAQDFQRAIDHQISARIP